MAAFWSADAATFHDTPGKRIVAELSAQQLRHFRISEIEQSAVWAESVAVLQHSIAALGQEADRWWILLEYPMLRLGMRIDALILTDRAIFVLEFKRTTADLSARRQVEDYALNLRDFHDSSRCHPIVPVLVSDGAVGDNPVPLFWHGVTDVQLATPARLAALLLNIQNRIGPPAQPLDPAAWLAGAYRPVPTIIEAACMTYARHGVADIRAARADAVNLTETTAAIAGAIDQARARHEKIAIFVTGLPGAGKTLCGLSIAFADADIAATFLTGNPTLVHVLREALIRDAVAAGASRRSVEPRIRSKIQRLPDFRNEYVLRPDHVPPEHIAVIDEAQRCWSREYAVRKTRDKTPRLTESEPGHLLDIIGRQEGFAACICLVGGGQEIHDGEGGLAEWGSALATRPQWRAIAAPDAHAAADPRWHLGHCASIEPKLHLAMSVRHINAKHANAWVNACLQGDAAEAHAIAANCALPFRLTRDLATARAAVRKLARGNRRAGTLASSEGKRLRAEGVGPELPHMDASAVAHWFLDRYPADIRASDALEQVATEFSCQGLELDYVLLGWDADLTRVAGQAAWQPRALRGTRWQYVRAAEAVANHLNSYRVLLTRARYETIIYVPNGDATDPTRAPLVYDAIATFLLQCGLTAVDDEETTESVVAAMPELLLL